MRGYHLMVHRIGREADSEADRVYWPGGDIGAIPAHAVGIGIEDWNGIVHAPYLIIILAHNQL